MSKAPTILQCVQCQGRYAAVRPESRRFEEAQWKHAAAAFRLMNLTLSICGGLVYASDLLGV